MTFHIRTVASLEAEMTAFGDGNATARTWRFVRTFRLVKHTDQRRAQTKVRTTLSGTINNETYIIVMTDQRRRKLENAHIDCNT